MHLVRLTVYGQEVTFSKKMAHLPTPLDGEWVFCVHSPPVFVTSTPEDDPPTVSDELDEDWVPYQWPLSCVQQQQPQPVCSSQSVSSGWEGAKRKIDFDNRPILVRKGMRSNPVPPPPPHMEHQQAKKRAKHLPPLHSGCIAPGTYIL